MSPSVFGSKNNIKIYNQNLKDKEIKKTILEYQKFIKTSFNYVGKNFTYEARSTHYKEKKASKGFYSIVSKEDFKELNEESIEVGVLPWEKNITN